jgi:ferric-dicitrate binding protein FerR (iron transport regulator)
MNSKNRKGLTEWLRVHANNHEDEQSLGAIWEASDEYSGKFQPDVEVGLAKFQNRISGLDSPNVVALRSRRRFLQMAAAVAMLLAAVSYFIIQDNDDAVAHLEAMTATGETNELVLADGSIAAMNAESRLTYPVSFTENKRELQLEGEAFFDVKRDESKPFQVSTQNMTVEVLGTSFNLRDKEAESFSEVFVKTGKVAVTIAATNERFTLEPGQLLSYDKNSGETKLQKDESGNPLAWKTKVLRFRNAPLSKIFSDMERLYGVEIKLENEALAVCPFTTTVRAKKLKDAFSALEASCDLTFTVTSPGVFTVSGACCQ